MRHGRISPAIALVAIDLPNYLDSKLAVVGRGWRLVVIGSVGCRGWWWRRFVVVWWRRRR